jgi:starch synthase
MRILMVASEAAPFVKTGGLADVLGGLPPALAALGHEVAVVLPKYRAVELYQGQRVYDDLPVWLGRTNYRSSVDLASRNGVLYYFINCPALYDRDGIYNSAGKDYPDNHIRFAVLCRAALEVVRRIFRPDAIHCHDWQTGLLPVYLRYSAPADPTFIGLKTLFTIHNLGYQGLFLPSILPQIGLDLSVFRPDLLEFYGDVNLLKGGIIFSDRVSTVSKTYAREIQMPEYGFGLDGVLRERSNVLSGIVNGVDYSEWDPQTDPYLIANYSADQLAGKQECKRALLEELGLPVENMARPVIGIVSRLAVQKGFDLVAGIAADLMAEDVALTVLGSGEPTYEQFFRDLAAAYPDRVGLGVGYNNPLAHRIEAGADMFLMPSHYEPCGLNQIYSLRYGAVPIVRATGGLDDTIDEDTGFKFYAYSGQALLDSLRTALVAFDDRARWQKLMRRGMRKDFSWNASALEYLALYQRLLDGTTSQAA